MQILETGDEVRRWAPPQINGQSCYFITVNRSKQSICIDLSKKEGIDLAKRLAIKSDVLLENFKTGQMKKFGLDYESLSPLNQKLIYCSITGNFIIQKNFLIFNLHYFYSTVICSKII